MTQNTTGVAEYRSLLSDVQRLNKLSIMWQFQQILVKHWGFIDVGGWFRISIARQRQNTQPVGLFP